MLKLDFHKAFDSVDWSFLLQVLSVRGFPDRFISWIHLLLSSSTSAVLLNGHVGQPFKHARGLRQGDPLSPFLFLIAADVLAKMVQAVSTSVPFSVSDKFSSPYYLLQYADDTLIFSTAKGRALRSLHLVLSIFSKVSGMKLNFNKTSFVPFNLTSQLISCVQDLFQCQLAVLPVQYLGLPLTSSKPDKAAYLNLIQKIDRRLPGWKSRFLSRAGRLVLASAVLSSIPIFFMSVFLLPSWVIKAIDRIRRGFIWGDSDNNTRKIHLLCWERVCIPKQAGGLGLSNIRLQNISLLLKWLWKIYDEPHSHWASIARTLYAKRDPLLPPLVWNANGSFFWKDLFKLRFYFQIFSHAIVRNGKRTLFWYGDWNGRHLAFLDDRNNLKPVKPLISLASALTRWYSIFPAPLQRSEYLIHEEALSLTLTQGEDAITWKCAPDGQFSVASTYKTLALAGKTNFPLTGLWKLKLPPTMKLFLFFLAHDRLPTQEQLIKRNMQIQVGCKLCGANCVETAMHLFFLCPYVLTLRTALPSHPTITLRETFKETVQHNFLRFEKCRAQITSLTTTLYSIWRERNNRTFRQESRCAEQLQHWTSMEIDSFLRFL